MSARYPDCDEIVVRDGVGISYERYGAGPAGNPAATDAVAGAFPARCMGGAVVSLAGAGHFPHARDPAQVNLLVKYGISTVSRQPALAVPSLHQRKNARHGEMERESAMAAKQSADRVRR